MNFHFVGLVNLSGPMNIPEGVRLVTKKDIENLTIPKIFMVAEKDIAAPDFVEKFYRIPSDTNLYKPFIL